MSDLSDDFLEGMAKEAAEEQKEHDARRRARQQKKLRDEITTLRTVNKELIEELESMEELRRLIDDLYEHPLQRYSIEPRETTSRLREACAVLVLSDLHLEEIVDLEETNGKNQFNPAIAQQRMESLAEGFVWYCELARSKYEIRDIFLPCLGDIITNYLRQEDIDGNGLTPTHAIGFAADCLAMLLQTILERCPWADRVYMPHVPGNHDRLSFSRKTPFRNRVGMSLLPPMVHILKREFRDEPRVVIELSKAEHHYTTIYGHTVRGMHGDRFSYHGGIGGVFIPARRHITGLNKMTPAHLSIFGHWHTSKSDDLWVSNGSLIGPNTYSIAKGLDPEPPQQTFFILDKERGKRLYSPIQVTPYAGTALLDHTWS